MDGNKRGGGRWRALLNYGLSLDKRLCSKHTKIDPDRPMTELNIYISYNDECHAGETQHVDFRAGYAPTELVTGGGYVRGT